ncbi:hypothetical protein [Parasitella parasitica]|uniref:ATP-dependent DNA helicase n=1 Tax=Parasitella parasitica TaxID=35722 RepID=A0A0B7NW86_9FUNG|nr:hypothetical protein [Parasitella parasitica]
MIKLPERFSILFFARGKISIARSVPDIGLQEKQNLWTFERQPYSSFQAAARWTGLVADDSEWIAAMTEDALFQSESFLRKRFCILIAFSGLSDPYQLWLTPRVNMAEDFLYRYQPGPTNDSNPSSTIYDGMYSHCLLGFNDILAHHCYHLQTMEGFSGIFSSVDTGANRQRNYSNTYKRMHALVCAQSLYRGDVDIQPFNEIQALIYSTIRDAALEEYHVLGPRIFFVDGPGGTDITTSTMCDMTPRSAIASFMKRAKIIVWDECSMVSKDFIETVNRSFQDFRDYTVPFGGRLIVFGGDFRQSLPIIRGADRSVIQALQSNESNLSAEWQQFAEYVLQIVQGTTPTIRLSQNTPTDLIPTPQEMCLRVDRLLNLIRSINFDIATSVLNADNFRCVTVRAVSYVSSDSTPDKELQTETPVEILNVIVSGLLPSHNIKLKAGSPIMVLRNIDPAAGICNGTKLIVNSIKTNVIRATIATGPNMGDITLIPRIQFITLAIEWFCLVDFECDQFPVLLSLAITVNKA